MWLDQNRPEQAEPLLQEALPIFRAQLGNNHRATIQAARTLGSCLLALDRYDEAEPLLVESFTYYQNEAMVKELAPAREALYDLYTAWSKPDKAAEYAQ